MSRWKVSDVMTRDVVSIHYDVGFKELVDLLVERGVSAVPVVDDADRVVGVVSEADLVHKLEFGAESVVARLFEGRRHRVAREKAVGDEARQLMISPAVTITADANVVEATRLMETKRDQAATGGRRRGPVDRDRVPPRRAQAVPAGVAVPAAAVTRHQK
jgi:CBS domain-containing protein